jgi:cellobiose phosphorylase
VSPCLPPEWPGYVATYRFGAAAYRITVERGAGVLVELDGVEVRGGQIPLCGDCGDHEVRIVIA